MQDGEWNAFDSLGDSYFLKFLQKGFLAYRFYYFAQQSLENKKKKTLATNCT